MCGRYSSSLPPELLARVFGTINELPNFPANYNLAPTQLAPVVRRHHFAERAAAVMATINAVHAFREGNGRTQRTFMRELAKAAGHDLDFSVISKARMIAASIAANEADNPGVMRRLFKDAVIPERRAALAKAIASLDKEGFPWNDRYIAAAEPGHSVVLTLAGVAGADFMGRTASAVIVGQASDLPRPPPARGETFTLQPVAWSVLRNS